MIASKLVVAPSERTVIDGHSMVLGRKVSRRDVEKFQTKLRP